jgi:hypothetical protein
MVTIPEGLTEACTPLHAKFCLIVTCKEAACYRKEL